MAFSALTGLLEQVKEVMIWNKDHISGSEDELKQLQEDLYTMKAFLKRKEKKSDEFSELERKITKVFYEMQETIDRLPYVKSGFSLPKALYYKLRSLLKKVEKLPDSSQGEEDPQAEFRTDMPIRQDTIVGFEDEVARITESLKHETECNVISIIGEPGQGKTTLAWKIYESREIKENFPIRIWINMSQYLYSKRDAFLQMLRKFIPYEDLFNLDDDVLVETARAYLERETFLLVLDNVRSEKDFWDIELEIRVLRNRKCKVLLTWKHNLSYNFYPGISSIELELKYLTHKESWTLLQYEVFGEIDTCDPELAYIGRCIANLCRGYPLIIVVIGGILSDLPTTGSAAKEWDAVYQNVKRAINDWNTDYEIVGQKILELSYNVLPYDLRDCFVYMGIFPEGYEVPVQMLLQLWIAEGFIQSKDGRSLEQSGEEILNYLIRRNLLKAQRTNHMGKVKTCRVHNMVREFCISKSEERNLFKEIQMRSLFTARVRDDLRRICLMYDLSWFLEDNKRGLQMRSILCLYKQSVKSLEPFMISLIRYGFPKLRILEFKSVMFPQFPAEFTKLIHLRYLTLFIDALETLPELISKLWNLQTLVVYTKRRSVTMEANMWKMFQLRHLKTKAAIVLDNKWNGEAGQNLQTLNRLSPDSCTKAVSKRAKNLKTLGISGDLTNIFKSKFLKNLHHLEKLKLVNSKIYKLTSEDNLPSLPQSRCFPPILKRLTLTNTFLEWKHMSTLAMINTLEVLKLKDNAFIGICWDAKDCFRQLQLLLIVNAHLVFWETSEESFPRLGCVVLKNCENLEEIPVALAKTLQKLDIDHLCQSAVDSARKIAELKRKSVRFPFTLNIGPSCF